MLQKEGNCLLQLLPSKQQFRINVAWLTLYIPGRLTSSLLALVLCRTQHRTACALYCSIYSLSLHSYVTKMASLRFYVAFILVITLVLFSGCETRPRFSGLVSMDYTSLEQGYSSKGAKGCQVISNALDSSQASDEDGTMQFLRCDWD
ncbi:hypothetical protein FHG87_003849 [Trinorchestia longiramus]|nr:hypothetical protein FHG87_003849 [Trinorchestia longiramus]